MTLPSQDSYDIYGGSKTDYTAIVDPTCDRSAAEINTAFASAAMATRTSIRAYCQILGHATTPTIVSHNAQWGNSLAVIPVIVRSATGVYSLTFPATVLDALGNTQSINLSSGQISITNTTPGFATVTKVNANTFTVSLFSAAGTASDLTSSPVNVWVI